jgi:hypothetical protein
MIFSIILGIQNFISAIFDNKWVTRFLLFLVLIVYATGWGEDFTSWPVRTSIYFVVGYGIILLKPILDRNTINRIKKKLMLSAPKKTWAEHFVKLSAAQW